MSNSNGTLDEIARRRTAGERIVFTNGCFDVLHAGHAHYLADARALGDLLVVGINSDASVSRLKGPSRPIVPEHDRAELLRALRVVDYVLLFEEDTPLELIKQVQPRYLVKGGDWAVEQIVGHEFVASYGGETLSLPFVPGRSSTSVIQRIESALSDERTR